MTGTRKVGWVAAVALVVAVGTAIFLRFGGIGDGGVREAMKTASTQQDDRGEAARAEATRSEVKPVEIEEEKATPGETVEEVDPELSLHGIVQDQHGVSIPGALVEVLVPPAREFTVLDLDYNRQLDELRKTKSDQAGTFAVKLERGRPVDLRVSAKGFATRWVPDRYAGERVVVVLTQGCVLKGRLTRSDDGSAVEGATMRVFRYGGPNSVSFKTTSDGDGSYRIDGLPADRMVLEVLPLRDRSCQWLHLEFGADGTLVKDIVVERGILVHGHVTDARSGAPIVGAEIGEGWTFRRSAKTDATGAYELPGFGSPGVQDVHVRAEAYGRQQRQNPTSAGDGSIQLDFALVAARRVRGRVLSSSHDAVDGAYVAAVASEFQRSGGQRAEWPSTRTGPDGRFEVNNLTPDLGHTLFVQKHGAAAVVYDLPAAEMTTPDLDVGDVVLPPAATLLGRVKDDEGHEVADVEVHLIGFNSDRYRWLDAGEARRPSTGDYVESRRARSDDLGRFSFADLPSGEFKVQVQPRGRIAPGGVTVKIAEGETKSDVVITIPVGAAIAGRIVGPSGAGISGAWIHVESRDQYVSAESASGGNFEIRGLAPGRYKLQARLFESRAAGGNELLLPAELVDVEAPVRDLRVELKTGAAIRGVLLDDQRRPVQSVWVQAKERGGERTWSDDTDRDGKFSITVPDGVDVELSVLRRSAGGFLGNEDGTLAAGTAADLREVTLSLPVLKAR